MTETYSREVRVTRFIRISVDPTKFTPEFMAEYSSYITDLETIDEHIEHLAELANRGVIDGGRDQEIEGYGKLSDMGITCRVMHNESEVLAPYDETGGEGYEL